MWVKDIMTTTVITASPETLVTEIAQKLLDKGISGMPVVDASGKLIGIVSEGDLVRRSEVGTEQRRSWWLDQLTGQQQRAKDYIKTHAMRAADIMTKDVVTVAPDDGVATVAELLEKHRIKRVPVVEDGRLVGIVSRSNLLQGLIAAAGATAPLPPITGDPALREAIMERIKESGIEPAYLNVIVTDGVVHLWGLVSHAEQRDALRIAAETTPGVKGVTVHMAATPMITI